MPRTLLGADTYKDKDLSELFYIYKRRAGFTFEQFAGFIGVSVSMAYKYFKEPSKIPLSDLRKIQKKLNIPVSKMNEFLF